MPHAARNPSRPHRCGGATWWSAALRAASCAPCAGHAHGAQPFGTVQVTQLAPLGALGPREGPDRRVRRFRSAKLALEEKQLELEQIDEQIKKAQADLAIRNNQDQVELLRARYSVRRAELEVKRNELLSTIDRKKNLLNLEEARRG